MKTFSMRTISILYALILTVLVIFPTGELIQKCSANHGALNRSGDIVQVSDFVCFYAAGQLASSPDRYDCYDHAVQKRESERLLGPTNGEILHIQYVPMVFAAMVPFSWLPLETAQNLWVVLSLLCFFGVGLLFASKSETYVRGNVWFWFLWTLAAFSTFQCLLYGQVSLFEASFFELFIWSWLNNRNRLAGLALALATVKPHYALFLILPALVGRRWQMLLSFAICETVLLAATAMIIGIRNVVCYPLILMQIDSSNDVNALAMPCLRGILSWLISDQHTVLMICLVALSAALIVFALLWKKMIANSVENQALLLSVSILLALAVSPHTHWYDYVLFSPCALLLSNLGRYDLWRSEPLPRQIWSATLMFYPLISWVLFLMDVPKPVNITVLTGILCILIGCGLTSLRNLDSTSTV